MRLATWNVNSLKARLDRVLAWTERQQPDILCMQETKLTDEQAPALDFRALGYELVHHGPGRWNGVAIASRVGIDEVTAGIPNADGWTDDGGRFLAATCGGVRVASIYVPNGRMVDSEFYLEKLDWLARLSGWLDDTDPATELAICGDYNVAPTDDDVWDAQAAHGATHVSPRERAAVEKLRTWGMVDVVRQFHPETGLLHLVGLPRRALPQELRHAHRPRVCHAAAGRAGRCRGARSGRPEAIDLPGHPLRPRPADRRLRRSGLGRGRRGRLGHRHLLGRRHRSPPLEELDDLHHPQDDRAGGRADDPLVDVERVVFSSRLSRSSWLARMMKPQRDAAHPEQRRCSPAARG